MKYGSILKKLFKSFLGTFLIFFCSNHFFYLNASSDSNSNYNYNNQDEINSLNGKADRLEAEVEKLKIDVQKSRDVRRSRISGVVATAGYFGLGAYYDGSSLIVLQPEVHRDLGVLKGVQSMVRHDIAEFGSDAVDHMVPHIAVSGYVESQAEFQDMNNSSIRLNAAELDFAGWVSKWMTGYTNFGFDDRQTPLSNFEMFLGFITVGNLDYSNWFMTAGQLYVPFGYFGTGMSKTGPIPKAIGRIKERAAKLAYYNEALGHTFYVSGATYRGKLQNDVSHMQIDQYATSLKLRRDWKYKNIPMQYDLTFSYTNNLAEADSLWVNLKYANNFKLHHFVPGSEAAGKFTIGKVSFRIEYVNSLKKYSTLDLMQNGRSVKPRAYAYELNYDTTLSNRLFSLNAIYTSGSDTAVAIPVKSQYGVSATWHLYSYTLLSAEIANRKFYGKNTTISGGALDPAAQAALMSRFFGTNDKIVSATIDVYF